MARNRNRDSEEDNERRERRQQARDRQSNSSGSSSSSSSSSNSSGKLDRNSGYQRSMETGEVINPSHFATREEWQEYYAALPQEFKRNYKEGNRANVKRRDDYLSRGGDYRDLGIRNEKEYGKAAYNRMSMHNLDKSYSYDWEKGVKYNVATSDDNVYMRPVPIEDWEWKEKAEIDKYGANPEGYQRRLQDSTRNTLNSWSAKNLEDNPNTGKIHRGPDGRLRAINSRNEYVYFDDFGRVEGSPDIAYDDQTGRWDQVKGVPITGSTPGSKPGMPPPGNLPPAGGSSTASSLVPPKPVTAPAPLQAPNMPAPFTSTVANPNGNAFGLGSAPTNLTAPTTPRPANTYGQQARQPMSTPQQTMPGQQINPFRQQKSGKLDSLGLR